MQPINITGLKHSEELFLLHWEEGPGPFLIRLCRSLSAERINLPLVLWSGPRAVLALDPPALPTARALAGEISRETGRPLPRETGPAVLLTVYPAGRSVTLPAALLACLAGRDIPILATGTSLSAAVAVVSCSDLPRALSAVQADFTLPSGASPAPEQVRVVQAGPRE